MYARTLVEKNISQDNFFEYRLTRKETKSQDELAVSDEDSTDIFKTNMI